MVSLLGAKVFWEAERFPLAATALKLFCMYSHKLPQNLLQMRLNAHTSHFACAQVS